MLRVIELILDVFLDEFPFRAQRHFLDRAGMGKSSSAEAAANAIAAWISRGLRLEKSTRIASGVSPAARLASTVPRDPRSFEDRFSTTDVRVTNDALVETYRLLISGFVAVKLDAHLPRPYGCRCATPFRGVH